ncbi:MULTISPECIES: decarboxylase [Stenotrophomonas]|uniref:decarboxylase n=1 Tax=Stenotrophomonas TaxID=40323 RepID=UPI00106F5257|nr:MULTISPECIES: decarboxylase [Stenotrophomonas maltophilia group]MBA0400464.1 decarboxylase [Stenotrophomonas maltophilia]QNA96101.1 decarboxylase [Stenotrophomonas maltophilia]HDS1075145.1 decarboxylase [Stenotrophomonas maltophilia]HDS1214599.1 decarboxylase [Stenotrophomonas maltophilia]HDS1549058.1 decarboxylase [Stenotrophomonas maltophilia]
MTAGSLRDKRRARRILAVSVLGVAFAASATEPAPDAAAEAPVFGAWRNLQTEAGYAPAQRNLAFAMLPQAATRGDRFAIVDREGKRAVCCLQVASPSLGVAALREQYHLPQAWVTDLSNGRSPARPYLPHVYAMQRVDELADYGFTDVPGAYSDLGGLLIPEGAALEADGSAVRLGDDRYSLHFQRQPHAEDDGALDRYTLQAGEGVAPIVVEVPFGTY